MSEEKEPKLRGFAWLKKHNPEKLLELQRKGGKNSPARGFNDRRVAKRAAKKAGSQHRPETRSFFQDRELARKATYIGHKVAEENRKKKKEAMKARIKRRKREKGRR